MCSVVTVSCQRLAIIGFGGCGPNIWLLGMQRIGLILFGKAADGGMNAHTLLCGLLRVSHWVPASLPILILVPGS